MPTEARNYVIVSNYRKRGSGTLNMALPGGSRPGHCGRGLARWKAGHTPTLPAPTTFVLSGDRGLIASSCSDRADGQAQQLYYRKRRDVRLACGDGECVTAVVAAVVVVLPTLPPPLSPPPLLSLHHHPPPLPSPTTTTLGSPLLPRLSSPLLSSPSTTTTTLASPLPPFTPSTTPSTTPSSPLLSLPSPPPPPPPLLSSHSTTSTTTIPFQHACNLDLRRGGGKNDYLSH
ncbi:hypothetical protein Pcinc_018904 [Petrolisthes cinctipes]|uniref:Uncharacterized protein n=1 Tax=Petrolisthes cinctipes TaxID=88211 RepID=A0AAE1FL85_PETCI|nr:hypothetical protein Pcinc_018904 [Petrolisthes cinctipes]